MANRNPKIHTENLKPVRTKAEAKKRGRKGGIKSGKARREKKLLSQIYGDLLADKMGVDGKGKTLDKVIKEILNGSSVECPASSKVSLIKEIREATEGSKIHQTGSTKVILSDKKLVKEVVDELWD